MRSLILLATLLLGCNAVSQHTTGECNSGQYNVLDSIPVSYHQDIAARTSQVDLSTYLNDAVDDAATLGCKQVFFPAGTYTTSAPVSLTGNVELHGAATGLGFSVPAEIKALATYVGDELISIESNDVAIVGLELDGDGLVDVGVSFNKGALADGVLVRSTKLRGFVKHAIKGGFVVDVLLDHILVQMGDTEEYCIDIQEEYGPQPASGYGVVSAELRNSNLNCGVRIGGYPVRVVGNTFEFDYEGSGPEAAIACQDSVGGRCTVADNYLELNVNENRVVPAIGILVPGGTAVIYNNVLLNTQRPADSIGIMLGTVASGGSQGHYSVFQNQVRAWETGIKTDPISSSNGLSSALWGNMYAINTVDLDLKVGTEGVHGAGNVHRHGIAAFDPDIGFTFRNRAIVGTIIKWVPSNGPIDLTYGNTFKVTADAQDQVSHTRATEGMQFTLLFDCPLSCPTLDASTWGLSSDLTPSDGQAYAFIVDDKANVVGVE